MEKKKKGKKARKGLLVGVICLAVVLVALVAAALAVWNTNVFSLVMTMHGDQEITLTFDQSSCTFCSMCADFCARKAIKLTDDYMIVGTEPEDFIVSGTFIKKAPPPKMTPEQIAELKAKAEAAKAAKAAAAAAAENG